MGARHVLLTHFSQRYPKLPISASRHTMGEFRDAVISVSFDLMSICIGDMWRMSHYMDAIDVLLAGDEDEDEVEEGDDAVKAVERQTSASLSEIGGGLSTVTAGVKHGKGRRGETGSPAQIERKKNQSSPTKRESSPLRPVPDLKKVKADCDWPSAEIE